MRATSTLLALAAAATASATSVLTAAPTADCPTLLLVYARATTEPPGSMDNADSAKFEAAAARVWSKGYGAAGFSLYSNVTKLIPGSAGYPVHYPASWTGCTSEDKGVADYLDQLSKVAAACPNTKFALGGHSQGGVVTVRTIPQIPKNILSRIVAVTMFGSPNCPAEVKDRCRSYCNQGDGICTGEGNGQEKGRCSAAGGKAGSASPKAGGMGPKAPKMGKGAEGGALGRMVDFAPPIVEAMDDAEGWQQAQCSGPEVQEKGHKAVGSEGAHMLYNKDGYYVKAAACFIYNRLQAATAGTAAPAMVE
ncbi:alpha/beta-hydrolase [Trichodelitschia bisporula]|uniref:Alpha/beta-hydrolase n=1 Tax=Trichodelitschia bisporula TaxID=703511 RepID=A0A6G1HYM7_9PEZI|nr:alpha/beta-hydrolase [Trichodelitschia bisporula]